MLLSNLITSWAIKFN